MMRGRMALSSLRRMPCARWYSKNTKLTNAEVSARQSHLFENEKQRQLSLVTRIEKIRVKLLDKNNSCTLIMNKGLSTPYNVAMHLNKLYRDRSALALVNGEVWDMLRPLTEDCEVELLHFKCDKPQEVNKAYWRSCSHMLGAIIASAFKDDFFVDLVRAPDVPVTAGCFCYDVDLHMDDWSPTLQELMCLSQDAFKMQEKELPFERLAVDTNLALEIFQDNRFKKKQITESGKSTTTLYRCGDFVDVSDGPMVTSTRFATNFSITAVHNIKSSHSEHGKLQRFQGVALPSDFRRIHHTVLTPIENRAKIPVYTDSDGPWIEEKEDTQLQKETSV
ncbi:large ribosomal subunit protein mL39-like [Ptychodera flava]|uniref:large ribosomal subunit protein mL39-like n=1 Tax=Ptychodera flava TaxID=63121 RepID=UPI00396A6B20